MRKWGVVFVVIGLMGLVGCVSYRYETVYSCSEPVVPDWYQSLPSWPKVVAILPFEGYSGKGRGVANQIESGIRAKLVQWDQFKVVEREHLRKIVEEQKFVLTGLTEEAVVELGRMLGADLIISGEVSDYREEDVYKDYVEGGQYAGDKYERRVSLAVSVRAISVETGEILYEEEKLFESAKSGYKNVRRIYKEKTSTGVDWLDALVTVAEVLSDLDLRIQAGIVSFAVLRDKCVKKAIDHFFWNLVAYKKEYKDTYRIDEQGNRERVSRDEVGAIPVQN